MVVILLVAFVFVLAYSIYAGIQLYRSNTKAKQLRQKVRTLVEASVPTPTPQPTVPAPLSFVTSLPTAKSKEDLIRMMNTYETAGIAFSTDPLDSTILQLQRKLMFPDMQTIGDEKRDYSQYVYRVRDKDGFVIELDPNMYGRLVDGDIITSIPGYEGVGTFEVDIYDKRYTLQLM